MMLLNPISVVRNADATQRNTIFAVLPMCHRASLDAASGVGAFSEVGGGQALMNRWRDVQRNRDKTRFQAFNQTGSGREPAVAEPICQFLKVSILSL